jgi:signal transduction histidine kinase
LQEEQERSKARARLVGLLLILGLSLVILLLLWRTTRQQQQANRRLNQKNSEIEKQRNELEQTLTELKAAQTQLVQQEKMASLGELTAGIAHEIQNPLNFVNNFSEVNLEMNSELKDKLKKMLTDGKEKDEIEEILNSIESNEQKIIHHGKRADAIVKGMLQHSRTTTGQKVLTNINAFVDEYLRLSYHGFRAKDEIFHVTMLTNFDPTVDQINIIPQDIGRVLLNLINNAFYAVSEKKKQRDTAEYKPTVTVETKKTNNKVEIKITDNGTGIPQKILEKIFQPFFTTKPTGQGTGLGLSLAFDIVKAHGGDIRVETSETVFSAFIVELPLNRN